MNTTEAPARVVHATRSNAWSFDGLCGNREPRQRSCFTKTAARVTCPACLTALEQDGVERAKVHAAIWTKRLGAVVCGSSGPWPRKKHDQTWLTPEVGQVSCPECLAALRLERWPAWWHAACPDCCAYPWEGHAPSCRLVERYAVPAGRPYLLKGAPQECVDYAAEMGTLTTWRRRIAWKPRTQHHHGG
jgi:hypothetical protein